MVVGTKQDLERVDLPFEEIEATVRIVSIMMVVMMLYSSHCALVIFGEWC